MRSHKDGKLAFDHLVFMHTWHTIFSKILFCIILHFMLQHLYHWNCGHQGHQSAHPLSHRWKEREFHNQVPAEWSASHLPTEAGARKRTLAVRARGGSVASRKSRTRPLGAMMLRRKSLQRGNIMFDFSKYPIHLVPNQRYFDELDNVTPLKTETTQK